MNYLPTILTIAGSDCSAGAGIQADLKTIHALGGYALTVPTALTAQNSCGVQKVFAVEPQQLQQQLDSLQADYQIDAIKIGMLANRDNIKVVTQFLQQFPDTPVVLDPIIISSSGKALLDEGAIDLLVSKLFPLTTLVTPNLPELNYLLGTDFDGSKTQLSTIEKRLKQTAWPSTLLKGGHSSETEAVDYLFAKLDENQQLALLESFRTERLLVQHNHGTGCTLSSAIATYLALGKPLEQAVGLAKEFLFKALSTAELAQPHYKTLTKEQERRRHGGLNHLA